jgi:hypothetical protein
MQLSVKVNTTISVNKTEERDEFYITAEHYLTKQDLEEYSKDLGYSSIQEYLEDNCDSGCEEEIKSMMKYIDADKAYLVEGDIEIYCGKYDYQRLIDFLNEKYANEMLNQYISALNDIEFNLEV